MRHRPLLERRKLLTNLLKKAPGNIRFSKELRGTREELLALAHKFQLEGLITKAGFSVRAWPAQRCLGESQNDGAKLSQAFVGSQQLCLLDRHGPFVSDSAPGIGSFSRGCTSDSALKIGVARVQSGGCFGLAIQH